MVQRAVHIQLTTASVIEEKINPVNGATAENNTYEYEFIYNFVVEQK